MYKRVSIQQEIQKRGIPNSLALEFLRAVTGKPDAAGRLDVRMMDAMAQIGLPQPDTHKPAEWIADNVEAIHAYMIKWKRENTQTAAPIPGEYRRTKEKKPKGFAGKRGGLSLLAANDFLRIVYGTTKCTSGIDDRIMSALKKIGHDTAGLKSTIGWEGINLIIREHIAQWKKDNEGVQLHSRATIISRQKKKVARTVKSIGNQKFYEPKTGDDYPRLTYDQANAPDFLESFEWRTLRTAALAKYGNACMCCGAKPDPARGITANVDHIKSRRKRPDLALCFDNLQVLCTPCNHGKANWDETDWRPKESRTPSVVIIDEPVPDEVEYVDMATVRLIQDIAKK